MTAVFSAIYIETRSWGTWGLICIHGSEKIIFLVYNVFRILLKIFNSLPFKDQGPYLQLSKHIMIKSS